MTELGTRIKNLQADLDKTGYGYCVSFRLLNYDELKVTIGQASKVMIAFNEIIDTVYRQLKPNSLFYTHYQSDRIILILPQASADLVRDIALQVHSASQLYIDDTNIEIYINCRIASVAFSQMTCQAEKIDNLLNFLLSNPDCQNYYQQYIPKQQILEEIRKSNQQLHYLRKALLEKSMVFAYQPVINSRTMKIHYYECLLRIPDIDNNFISAGSSILQAEKNGLIFIIDRIVLEMVIKELVANPDLTLAINISNISMLDDNILLFAKELLQQYDIFGRLIIEITETTLNQHYKKTTAFINELKKFGCRFAIDDFGAGFTSFRQLQNLPIDIIKIDGSYVRNIQNDQQSQDFISRIIKISEDLNILTVAEFVENNDIAQCIINLKVGAMQGNFFAPASLIRASTTNI